MIRFFTLWLMSTTLLSAAPPTETAPAVATAEVSLLAVGQLPPRRYAKLPKNASKQSVPKLLPPSPDSIPPPTLTAMGATSLTYPVGFNSLQDFSSLPADNPITLARVSSDAEAQESTVCQIPPTPAGQRLLGILTASSRGWGSSIRTHWLNLSLLSSDRCYLLNLSPHTLHVLIGDQKQRVAPKQLLTLPVRSDEVKPLSLRKFHSKHSFFRAAVRPTPRSAFLMVLYPEYTASKKRQRIGIFQTRLALTKTDPSE